MTAEQAILFAIFVALFVLMAWGRFRYDLVAMAALVAGVGLSVVPAEDAFSGFGHPATITVALVLVVSRGLVNSGAIAFVTGLVVDGSKSVARHIVLIGGIGAALSTIMNNVAALAMLMPVDIDAAGRAKRSPALTLMPLSFATILGGLVTMIGTPPNIIVASFSRNSGGSEFGFFSYTPVGLACAAAGLVFIALIGWRLIPASRSTNGPARDLLDATGYTSEVLVPEKSPAIGKLVSELDEDAEEAAVVVQGLVRRGKRLAGRARRAKIAEGDILVLEADPVAIDRFVGKLDLSYAGEERHRSAAGGDLALLEVVVPRGARIEGRSAEQARFLVYYGITLLGLSRQGRASRERVGKIPIRGGDVLLLLGPADRLADVANRLGVMPLADRGLTVTQHSRAGFAAGAFLLAVIAASFGFMPFAVALAAVVVLFAATDIVPPRQLYDAVDWPVVVLLGALIPLGAALDSSGGTALIAGGLIGATGGMPAWVIVAVLMVVTMTLSDILNNNATALVAAPVAIDIAGRLDVSPDPLLMAVAVGASCAFLTPIGHQNNTLILGPGGYAFTDYWRMGLPLEAIVIAVGLPMILLVWPL